jgi:hypothetical protein
MSEQGMRQVFSVLGRVLALSWSLGLAACATSEAGEPLADGQVQPASVLPGAAVPDTLRPDTTSADAVRAPQQVVQQLRPAPERLHETSNGSVLDSPERPSPGSRAQEQDRAAEPLTAKHLEAELNRLEAELGR